MSDFYTGLAATATRLLTEYGIAAVVRNTPITSTDPSAGTVTTGTPVDTAVQALRTTWNEEYFEGQTVEQGDVFFILDGQPNIEDVLIFANTWFEIANVRVIKPAETFLACVVQARGGWLVSGDVLYDADGNPLQYVGGDYIETLP